MDEMGSEMGGSKAVVSSIICDVTSEMMATLY